MNVPKNLIRICALLFAAGVAAFVLWPRSEAAGPRYRWLVGDGKDLTNYQEVAADTQVRLEVDLTRPAHVYVVSHNPTDGSIALFPSPWLQSDLSNPLPAGKHVLPGRFEDERLAWPVRATLGATDYLAVISEEPLQDLEEILARTRQISNSTFPDHRMVVTAPRNRSMDDVPPRTRLPHPLLQAAAALAEPRIEGRPVPYDGDSGVLLASMKVVVRDAPGPKPSDK